MSVTLHTQKSLFQPHSMESQAPVSNYRRVFQGLEEMRTEFVKFLKTIFYKLDEKKVLSVMDKLLEDPSKTDEQIYTELLTEIGGMKKSFAPIWELYSLRVLKQGMGAQASELMKNFKKESFHNYMEIYFRRYCDVLRKIGKLPLDKQTIGVTDDPKVGISERIQAGAIFSKFPYNQHVSLNEGDCKDPLLEPEKTHKPIGDEVPNQSIDLIACLGGFHHIPKDRLDTFIDSLHDKLKPGAVLLVRDHNVGDQTGIAKLSKEDLAAIVSVVHSFVNAANAVSPEIEKQEVREFRSSAEWTEVMKRHRFTPISTKNLVLKDDPTENGMMAFVRTPETLDELRQAMQYRSDCIRPIEGTRATWIEWGNVRFSKQYAEFIQNHHPHAFDYLGHMSQHWQYFYHYVKESMQDGMSLKDLVLSDNMAMNLFILSSAVVQNGAGLVTNLPSMAYAYWKDGADWRKDSHLTDLEKFNAKVEKEYSSFIDHTPFYQFDYLGKIKPTWSTIDASKESIMTKATNAISASFSTMGYLAQAAVSAPIRWLYTSEAYQEPDTIKVLCRDPNNQFARVIEKWETDKDPIHEKNHKIEVISATQDGYKLVSLPRYRPFTQICGYLSETAGIDLLEIGGQKGISIDVLLKAEASTPKVPHSRLIYKMDKLQDAEKRSYATYHVAVSALQNFVKTIGKKQIEYIHE